MLSLSEPACSAIGPRAVVPNCHRAHCCRFESLLTVLPRPTIQAVVLDTRAVAIHLVDLSRRARCCSELPRSSLTRAVALAYDQIRRVRLSKFVVLGNPLINLPCSSPMSHSHLPFLVSDALPGAPLAVGSCQAAFIKFAFEEVRQGVSPSGPPLRARRLACYGSKDRQEIVEGSQSGFRIGLSWPVPVAATPRPLDPQLHQR